MADDKKNEKPGLIEKAGKALAELARDQVADLGIDAALGWIPFGPLAAKIVLAAGKVAVGHLQDEDGQNVAPKPELDLIFKVKPYDAKVNGKLEVIYSIAAPLKGVALADHEMALKRLEEFRRALPADFGPEERRQFDVRMTDTEKGTKRGMGWEICSFRSDGEKKNDKRIASLDKGEAEKAAAGINHILHPARGYDHELGDEGMSVVFLGTHVPLPAPAPRPSLDPKPQPLHQALGRPPLGRPPQPSDHAVVIPPYKSAPPPIPRHLVPQPRLIPRAQEEKKQEEKKPVNPKDVIISLSRKMQRPTVGALTALKERLGGGGVLPESHAVELEKDLVNKIVRAHNTRGDDFGAMGDAYVATAALVKSYDDLVKAGRLNPKDFLRERYAEDYKGTTGEKMARQFVADIHQAIGELEKQRSQPQHPRV